MLRFVCGTDGRDREVASERVTLPDCRLCVPLNVWEQRAGNMVCCVWMCRGVCLLVVSVLGNRGDLAGVHRILIRIIVPWAAGALSGCPPWVLLMYSSRKYACADMKLPPCLKECTHVQSSCTPTLVAERDGHRSSDGDHERGAEEAVVFGPLDLAEHEHAPERADQTRTDRDDRKADRQRLPRNGARQQPSVVSLAPEERRAAAVRTLTRFWLATNQPH